MGISEVQAWAPAVDLDDEQPEERTWPYNGQHSTVYRVEDEKGVFALKVLRTDADPGRVAVKAERIFE